ncbi:MAG: methionyl-tRNA formyltransferase [Bacteroidales bacterium]
MNTGLRIVFMGTPDFAVSSLEVLVKNGYQVVAVVTAPDRPAGRGRQIRFSPVKGFALQHQIPILQPERLKSEDFITALKGFEPDLQIVVAFRMLPEVVWKLPPLGTFNLHASLLPQYRGAAPINWAIINGEAKTGVTTFFLDDKIDTGEIILNKEVAISPIDVAGDLHDKLQVAGAELVLETVRIIESGNFVSINQDSLLDRVDEVRIAPKIFKDDCRIDWSKTRETINNLIRGLSPYPCAFTGLISPEGDEKGLKIYKASLLKKEENEGLEKISLAPGNLWTNEKNCILVGCQDGVLSLDELQLEGKRRMKTDEFLRGFKLSNGFKVG